MTMHAHLQLTFEPTWPNVREIREQVASALEACPEQVRSAAVMTASELVENAVKYSEKVAGARAVSFELDATPELLSVRVSNGSTNAPGIAELRRRIDELTRAEDKQALYLARLEELLTQAGDSSELGIYRIGFEGGFDLQLEYANDVVSIVATRKSNA
jgi:hypothetical protein